MPRSYPSSVRRQVSLRLRGGELVAEIVAETGISPATLFRWKNQALVDAGARAGVPSVDSDGLANFYTVLVESTLAMLTVRPRSVTRLLFSSRDACTSSASEDTSPVTSTRSCCWSPE
jgi:transposase-like protein